MCILTCLCHIQRADWVSDWSIQSSFGKDGVIGKKIGTCPWSMLKSSEAPLYGDDSILGRVVERAVAWTSIGNRSLDVGNKFCWSDLSCFLAVICSLRFHPKAVNLVGGASQIADDFRLDPWFNHQLHPRLKTLSGSLLPGHFCPWVPVVQQRATAGRCTFLLKSRPCSKHATDRLEWNIQRIRWFRWPCKVLFCWLQVSWENRPCLSIFCEKLPQRFRFQLKLQAEKKVPGFNDLLAPLLARIGQDAGEGKLVCCGCKNCPGLCPIFFSSPQSCPSILVSLLPFQ